MKLPETAQVDFYTTLPGDIPAVRFRMDGGIWWLFSGGTMAQQKLIATIDGSGAAYETVTLGDVKVQRRGDAECNIFCWTGAQTLLLYNQAQPALLAELTDEELQTYVEKTDITVEELRARDQAWPLIQAAAALYTAQAVCEAVG